MDTLSILPQTIRCNLFATCTSLEEAEARVLELAKATGTDAHVVLTAVRIYANTIADVLDGKATIHEPIKATVGEAIAL